MLDFARPDATPVLTVAERSHHDRVSWWLWYALCIVGTIVVAAIAVTSVPKPFSLAIVLLVVTLAIALARPVLGIYLAVFLSTLGDPVTSQWYPFTKDFSSPESILFVNPSLIFSPLEIVMAVLLFGWVIRMAVAREWTFHKGRLFWPVMAFTGFLIFGLVNGFAHHADSHIALAESRLIFYLPIMYVLVTNLLTKPEQYRRVYWLIATAVCINGVLALIFLSTLSEEAKQAMDSLVDHPATLVMNLTFLLLLAAWFFADKSQTRRFLLPLMAAPVVVTYLISERRAAVVSLAAGVLVMAALMFKLHRRAFWKVFPIVAVVSVVYIGAFWNSGGTLGFPAQAVKSVIAPGQLNDRDKGSDQYRTTETYDIIYTIRSSPLTGIGFGRPFLQPVALPAISAFQLNKYVTHNSILWMWMKVGIGGFIAMMVMFGTAVRTGAQTLVRLRRGPFFVTTLLSTTFVVMYAVFTYVDITWDRQNMVLLAFALAQIGSAPRFIREDASEAVAGDVLVPG